MTDFTGRGTFKAQVDAIVRKNKELMTDIVKEAAFEIVDEASKPRQKGGNMPVVTSFLRNSVSASLSGMPAGPDRPSEGATYGYDPARVLTTIAGLKVGGTLWVGWTAVYARRMNFKYGFLDLAVQKWPQIVDRIIRKLRS